VVVGEGDVVVLKALKPPKIADFKALFGGVPRAALDAWVGGRYELVLSPLIFDEYLRTCAPAAAIPC
jgi:hypothetical protein